MNAFETEPKDRSYYKILDTDYDSYAILYRCNDESWTGITTEYVTILSRTPTVDEAWMEKVRARVAQDLPDYDMSNWNMYNSDQGDDYCTYDFNLYNDEN